MTGFRERRYTAQDGLSLYYREYGDPESDMTPLLCLPGLTRNSKDFHSLALRLSAKRHVICPDYRGRGMSDYDTDAATYQPSIYLNDLRHLLAITSVRRVVVFGTSLGGLLAMGMGAAMPTTFAGVLLNDVGPQIASGGLGRIMEYVSVDRPHANWDSAIADFKLLFPSMPFASDADWLAAAEATWRRGEDGALHFDWDVRVAKPLRKRPPVPDLWPLFHSLDKIPMIAIRGALSDVLSEDTFDKMATARPGLQRVTVPETGHVPTLNEPIVRDRIDAFLASIQP